MWEHRLGHPSRLMWRRPPSAVQPWANPGAPDRCSNQNRRRGAVIFRRGLDHLHRDRPFRRRVPNRHDVDNGTAAETPAPAQSAKCHADSVRDFSRRVVCSGCTTARMDLTPMISHKIRCHPKRSRFSGGAGDLTETNTHPKAGVARGLASDVAFAQLL